MGHEIGLSGQMTQSGFIFHWTGWELLPFILRFKWMRIKRHWVARSGGEEVQGVPQAVGAAHRHGSYRPGPRQEQEGGIEWVGRGVARWGRMGFCLDEGQPPRTKNRFFQFGFDAVKPPHRTSRSYNLLNFEFWVSPSGNWVTQWHNQWKKPQLPREIVTTIFQLKPGGSARRPPRSLILD